MKLQITLTKPQSDFLALQDECLYPLFTGGYGSGKSFTMTISAFLDALHHPKAWVGIYEPNYSHIRDIAMPYMQALLEEHKIPYTINKNEFTIVTQSKYVGNFRFKSMENPDTLVGYETYTAHVDEIDTMDQDKAQHAWHKILGRTRQNPKGLDRGHMVPNATTGKLECRHKVCAYSTPEGYKFTYKLWACSNNPQYRYYQAKSADNNFLETSYIEQLRASYPDGLIDAYLEGKWCNLDQKSVYHAYLPFDEDKRPVHHSDEAVQRNDVLHVGMDFNVGEMACVIFVKRGDCYHAVDEVVHGYDTPDVIDTIKTRYPKHKIYCYPDASGDNRTALTAKETNITLLKQAGFIVRTRKANPLIADRISCVNRRMEEGKISVNTYNCPHTSNCLMQQPYDKNGKPDKKNGYDHQVDAFGYAIIHLLPFSTKIVQIPVKWAG